MAELCLVQDGHFEGFRSRRTSARASSLRIMNLTDDQGFPEALSAVAKVFFDYGAGEADYEPHKQFLTAERTTTWIRAWTRNQELDGDDFRVVGEDGTGGYAAFWLVRMGRPVSEQPVVFFGSEGDLGVVAPDLGGYLWVLADGSGPFEAVDERERSRPSQPHAELTAIAERFAPGRRRPARTIIEAAQAEFPGFEDYILGLCRIEGL